MKRQNTLVRQSRPSGIAPTPAQIAQQQALEAFYRQRSESLQQPNGYTTQPAQQGSIWDSIAIHPASLLDWVRRKIDGAQQ